MADWPKTSPASVEEEKVGGQGQDEDKTAGGDGGDGGNRERRRDGEETARPRVESRPKRRKTSEIVMMMEMKMRTMMIQVWSLIRLS
jgi:hypothetical protein